MRHLRRDPGLDAQEPSLAAARRCDECRRAVVWGGQLGHRGGSSQWRRRGQAEAARLKQARSRLGAAWGLAAFVGGLTCLVSLIAEIVPVYSLLKYLNWGSFAEGVLYLVLAYFIRRRSRVALGITTGLYVLDGVAALRLSHNAGAFLLIRIFIVIAFVRAFSAINVLRRSEAGSASPPGSSLAA